MSAGKVVHVLGPHPYDAYVGRAMPRHGLKASEWQNPFKVGRHGRSEALRLYEDMVRRNVGQARRWPEDPVWREYPGGLRALRAKTLACWCAEPRDRVLTTRDETVCHAQILLRLAEELAGS